MYHKDGKESIFLMAAILGVSALLTFEYVYAIIKMLEVVP